MSRVCQFDSLFAANAVYADSDNANGLDKSGYFCFRVNTGTIFLA